MPYKDLRQYLGRLEEKGLLHWIEREVDPEWEVSCINRSILHGLPEGKRFAVGFRRISGFSDASLVVGVMGISREHIAAAMEVTSEGQALLCKMSAGLAHRIPPRIVSTGPCKEVIDRDQVNVRRFPAVVWSPGKDAGPYFTPMWFTRDPETGRRNVGIYRSQVKGPNKLGIWTPQDAQRTISRWWAQGKPCPAAVAIGADPVLYLAAGAKMPYGFDETEAAGGLRGEAVELVPCETVPLEVPAAAEIVFEGEFHPGESELEGPFGEFTGYMAASQVPMPVFTLRCITHRRDPIAVGLSSQFPLSESSILRQATREACVFKHMRYDLMFDWVVDFHFPVSAGTWGWSWIKIHKIGGAQVERAVAALIAYMGTGAGKWIVVCDDDVDIRDPAAREWVLSYRVQPESDLRVVGGIEAMPLDPSMGSPEEVAKKGRGGLSSRVIIDATCKWRYPEIALPPREMLKRVGQRWHDYTLPPLGELWFPCEWR
jgi:UbiD family decarboxylase